MELLDAQVHMWLSDRPSRPWVSSYRPSLANELPMLIHTGQTMSPEHLLVEMAEAGVDGGVLSPVGVYGNDNSFELETMRRFPRKFCVVGWIDHTAPDVADVLAADVAAGMSGVRLLGVRDQARHERNEFDAVLAACEELGCTVSLPLAHPLAPGVRAVIEKYSAVTFIIDHLGLGLAPPTKGPAPQEPFANLDAVLDLARYDNVYLKLTGVPSLSREVFPFRDIWPAVRTSVDAFGAERVMWGTDFTRTAALHSYWDATHYLTAMDAFDDEQLRWLYGGTLRRALRWAPPINKRPSA